MGSGGISTGRAGGGVGQGQRLPYDTTRVPGANPGAQNVATNQRATRFMRSIRSAPKQSFESDAQYLDRQRGAARLRSSVLSINSSRTGRRVGTTALFRFRTGAVGGAGSAARQQAAVMRFLRISGSSKLRRLGRRGTSFAISPGGTRVGTTEGSSRAVVARREQRAIRGAAPARF